MKLSDAAIVIEFSLRHIMENTHRIFATVVIGFFASSFLGEALVIRDSDISKDLKKQLDHDSEQFLRETRQEDTRDISEEKNDFTSFQKKWSESENPIHDKKTTVEEEKEDRSEKEMKQIPILTAQDSITIEEEEENNRNETQENSSSLKTKNNTEEKNNREDITLYKSMHDFIQSLMFADEEDVVEKLHQFRKTENLTEAQAISNLPKRQIPSSVAAAAAGASTSRLMPTEILGANFMDRIPVTDLDAHSCEAESFGYGHVHVSGVIVHEFFCELRKLCHYILIAVRNFRSQLTMGPIITGDMDTVNNPEATFDNFFRYSPHLARTLIREPHHLLILPDLIRDAVPIPSLSGAFYRLRHVFIKLTQFARELFGEHFRNVFQHFFRYSPIISNLRDKQLPYWRNCLENFDTIVPVEEIIRDPLLSASSISSATATATSTSYNDDFAPQYYKSLAELISSFRGAYDGYYASGMPQLIRSGVQTFSSSSASSTVTSFLSRIPFVNYFRPADEQTMVTTATSTSSSSVNGPVAPIVPLESETASSSSTTTTVTETRPIVPMIPARPIVPMIPSAPTIISTVPAVPYDSSASSVSSSSAAAISPALSNYRIPSRVYPPSITPLSVASTVGTSNIAVDEGLPVVPYNPLIQPLRPLLPTIVPKPVESAISQSSSSSISLSAPTPAVFVPNAVENAAAQSISSAYSLTPSTSVIIPNSVENVLAETASSKVLVTPPERPVVIPNILQNTAATSASSVASATASNVAPFSNAVIPPFVPLSRYNRPTLANVIPTAAGTSSASISSSGSAIEPIRYNELGSNTDGRRFPFIRPSIFPSAAPSAASASSSSASSVSDSGVSSSSSSASSSTGPIFPLSLPGFNFVVPREKIIGALGNDYLLPGDIITITLKNRSVLIGRILDNTSPITFNFLRPRLSASVIRNGGRVWNLLPKHFRDPECD